MNLDQDVRTMLRARAEGVAAAPSIPHSTLRRVRVRKTLMAGGVAAVVAAVVLGGFVASRSLTNDAAPIPPADKTDFPALTESFVSPRNGFSIKHPGGVELTPATQLCCGEPPGEGFDVLGTGSGVVFRGASIDFPYGSSVDDYMKSHGGCGTPSAQQEEITIDGQSGRISECPNEIEATVVFGGRLYLFTLSHERSDDRAVFDAFAATIDLTPETAVDIPNLTTTFVSPTYGYSFKYFDRGKGTLTPATELWDPVNQPPIDSLTDSNARYLDQFDFVETGLAAVFLSASTEIPDGVSIDEWVDAAVVKYLPAGCYVPRSQQATIAIDGRVSKVLECPGGPIEGPIVATVVAGGRLYLFMGGGDRHDARAFFDDWVETIELTPETAAVP